MIYRTELSRRHVLAVAGMAAAGMALAAAPAAAAPKHPRWLGRTSQNGWPVVDATKVATVKVEGSNAGMALLPGDVATVLLHVARRFHYEVDALASGDVHGHTTIRTVAAAYESNYLSGTALAIRPNVYPTGSAGSLFPTELLVVRDILAECDGVVRWGGDDMTHPKDGHFQIDVPPGDARLRAVAAKIRGWQDKPGQGAGAPADPASPMRRAAARSLQLRQQR